MDEQNTPKRGRPRLSEEEKQDRATKRKTGELPIQRRNRPDLKKFGQENVEPGDNSKYIRHALTTLSMPPIDISDPRQVEERIGWYFCHCADNDMKPTVTGFCNALGVPTETARAWRIGKYRAGTHQDIVAKAYSLLEELWEDYMLNGKVNPVSGIFLAKNHFGYSDKQEYVVTPNTQQLSQGDLATIEAKYDELPDGDGE